MLVDLSDNLTLILQTPQRMLNSKSFFTSLKLLTTVNSEFSVVVCSSRAFEYDLFV